MATRKMDFEDSAVVAAFFDTTGYHWNHPQLGRHTLMPSARTIFDNMHKPRSQLRDSLGFTRRQIDVDNTYVRVAKFDFKDLNSKSMQMAPGMTLPLFTTPAKPIDLLKHFEEAYKEDGGFTYIPKGYREENYEDLLTRTKKLVEDIEVKKSKVKNQKMAAKPPKTTLATVFTNDNFKIVDNTQYSTENSNDFGLIYILAKVKHPYRSEALVNFGVINFDADFFVEPNGDYTLRIDTKHIMPAINDVDDKYPLVTYYFEQLVDKLQLKRLNFWPSVTRIIINNVRCDQWDQFLATNKDIDGNYRYLGLSIANKAAIITNGYYENTNHFNSKTYKMTKEDLIKKWADVAIGNLKNEVEVAEQDLRSAKQELMRTSKAVGEKRKILRVLSVNADEIFTKAMADIEQVPGIADIQFDEGFIVATTEDVYYDAPPQSHFKNGPRAYIGKFKIFIGILTNSAFIYNVHMSSKKFPHPHCSEDNGEICSGGFESMIASALESVDYQLVLSAIMELLRTCTEEDYYGKTHITSFAGEPPTEIRVSQPIKLYGDMIASINAMTLELPTPGLVKGTGEDEDEDEKPTRIDSSGYLEYDEDDEDEEDEEEDDDDDDDDEPVRRRRG